MTDQNVMVDCFTPTLLINMLENSYLNENNSKKFLSADSSDSPLSGNV